MGVELGDSSGTDISPWWLGVREGQAAGVMGSPTCRRCHFHSAAEALSLPLTLRTATEATGADMLSLGRHPNGLLRLPAGPRLAPQ
jgi:hypothetical protein